MRLKILKSFRDKLNDQIDYIAKDKPAAARKFKSDLIQRIKDIPKMPYANRKSIFFERENIRDLVFKAYIIVYKIDEQKKVIEAFGFTKFEDDPFLR